MPPKRKLQELANSSEAKKAKDHKQSDIGHGLEWNSHGKEVNCIPPLVFLKSSTVEVREKVVAFDIDWTITATKSGAKFCTGPTDWKWWNVCIPAKLKSLDKEGYRIVFFSNQGGIEKKKGTILDVQKRINAIVNEIDLPIYAFFSTGENEYRKPSTGMWDFFVEKCCPGIKLNLSECIYVGDAAGRPKNWAVGKSKDFSCSDRMFASNIAIEFKTPEEFFLNHKSVKFEWRSFDAKNLIENSKSSTEIKDNYHSNTQELVILVGLPASGKTTFANKYFIGHKYVHINRDNLGTPTKCFKLAEESLAAKKSVIVDNTNPKPASRKEYIDLAKKYKVACRCFFMDTPRNIAGHLNYVRQNRSKGEIRRIPDVGFNVFKSHFTPPNLKEGFDEVKIIKFEPQFEDDNHKQLFMQWTA